MVLAIFQRRGRPDELMLSLNNNVVKRLLSLDDSHGMKATSCGENIVSWK